MLQSNIDLSRHNNDQEDKEEEEEEDIHRDEDQSIEANLHQ